MKWKNNVMNWTEVEWPNDLCSGTLGVMEVFHGLTGWALDGTSGLRLRAWLWGSEFGRKVEIKASRLRCMTNSLVMGLGAQKKAEIWAWGLSFGPQNLDELWGQDFGLGLMLRHGGWYLGLEAELWVLTHGLGPYSMNLRYKLRF